MWINAIRLSVWERSRCNEIWTGSLLGLREPRPLGWQGFEAGLPVSGNSKPVPAVPGRVEGWIKVRLPGDTEWRRVWAVILRGANVPTRSGGPAAAVSPPAEEKKSKRSSLLSFGSKKDKKEESPVVAVETLPGEGAYSTLAFFDRKPKKGDQPICIAQHVFYGQSRRAQDTCSKSKLTLLTPPTVSAIFPESEALLEHSTLFKIEGTFLDPSDGYLNSGWGIGGRAEKQGYGLLMLEEGGLLDMLHWIVALADVFKVCICP